MLTTGPRDSRDSHNRLRAGEKFEATCSAPGCREKRRRTPPVELGLHCRQQLLEAVAVPQSTRFRDRLQAFCKLVETGYGYMSHIRSRGKEKRARKQTSREKSRRWEVERTHGWLNRFRAILVRWEKRTENHIAVLHSPPMNGFRIGSKTRQALTHRLTISPWIHIFWGWIS